jgi:Glycosyl hydrolase 36 superfamily, catalytic domain
VNRRTFVGYAGVGAAHGIGLARIARFFEAPAAISHKEKAYGSGHFGEWITDQFALPAYRYNCNQLSDPLAHAEVQWGQWGPPHPDPDYPGPDNHWHQVGNDRLVAVASNYGYVQVRQDEGGPKFLNDYAPDHNRFGGGIGYLYDGKSILSTYYSGGGNSFERIWGEGYLRKIVAGSRCTVDQTIFAPYGEDPVLISLVKITNRSSDPVDARWVEYWNCENYQLSLRTVMEARSKGNTKSDPQLRHSFGDRFRHHFAVVANNKGLVETQQFLGRTVEDEQTWAKVRTQFAMAAPAPGTAFDDLNPPPTFLISLDAPMDGYSTDAGAFFGDGGVMNPSGLREKLKNDATSSGPASAHLIERSLSLQPSQTRTIAFLYGYLPQGFELHALVAKYSGNPTAAWAYSSEQWKTAGLRFKVAEVPWVERENSWNNYYLRSALTYDSFFREFILSQGGNYQYIWGFQGQPCDPLQHMMPLIFSDPEIVRGVIRYTLKESHPDGFLPYGIAGYGALMMSNFVPSMDQLFLLWAVSEYILATRDKTFLSEKIPLYPRQQVEDSDPTVFEQVMNCYRYLLDTIGVGAHGLMRLLNDDWDDGMTTDLKLPAEMVKEIRENGESVLNAAMACYVLDHFARTLEYLGETKHAEEAHFKAAAQRDALRAQWTGRWFRRAWLGPQLGWLGDEHDQLWLEPQTWAIICGATTREQSATLVRAVDELLRVPSPIGAMIRSKGTAYPGKPIGTWENGGVWASINATLIWALARQNGAMAWDEWKKNSLACRAEAYPNIWYGIWSGPDFYNSVLAQHPGETYPSFPIMNLHSHWMTLYTTVKLLGLEFNERGLSFKPSLPPSEYELNSPLVGFTKSNDGYSGWYQPSVAGNWEVEIQLPRAERARFKTNRINGESHPIQGDSESIQFRGESSAGKPLLWQIH